MPKLSQSQETQRGFVQWHCSEQDSGPDVGILIGLGSGKALYLGERSNKEGGGNGILIYDAGVIVKNLEIVNYDELRDVLEFHIAPALKDTPNA